MTMHRPPARIHYLRSQLAVVNKQIADGLSNHATRMLLQTLEAALQRAVRQQVRADKRSRLNEQYRRAGLNGKQAVERRLRQIAAGSLRAENGLVE